MDIKRDLSHQSIERMRNDFAWANVAGERTCYKDEYRVAH
jgi:hypothetical protein